MASLIVQCEVFDRPTAARKGVPFEFHWAYSGTEPAQWEAMVLLLDRVRDVLQKNKPEEVTPVRKYATGEVVQGDDETVQKTAGREAWTAQELADLRAENDEADDQ